MARSLIACARAYIDQGAALPRLLEHTFARHQIPPGRGVRLVGVMDVPMPSEGEALLNVSRARGSDWPRLAHQHERDKDGATVLRFAQVDPPGVHQPENAAFYIDDFDHVGFSSWHTTKHGMSTAQRTGTGSLRGLLLAQEWTRQSARLVPVVASSDRTDARGVGYIGPTLLKE
jgi:hypothetical protein